MELDGSAAEVVGAGLAPSSQQQEVEAPRSSLLDHRLSSATSFVPAPSAPPPSPTAPVPPVHYSADTSLFVSHLGPPHPPPPHSQLLPTRSQTLHAPVREQHRTPTLARSQTYTADSRTAPAPPSFSIIETAAPPPRLARQNTWLVGPRALPSSSSTQARPVLSPLVTTPPHIAPSAPPPTPPFSASHHTDSTPSAGMNTPQTIHTSPYPPVHLEQHQSRRSSNQQQQQQRRPHSSSGSTVPPSLEVSAPSPSDELNRVPTRNGSGGTGSSLLSSLRSSLRSSSSTGNIPVVTTAAPVASQPPLSAPAQGRGHSVSYATGRPVPSYSNTSPHLVASSNMSVTSAPAQLGGGRSDERRRMQGPRPIAGPTDGSNGSGRETRPLSEEEAELARIQEESIRAEQRRQYLISEQERMYNLTLAASSHSSQQRAQELEAARQAEEDELRRVMEKSRLDKGKGRVQETEEQRRERDELDYVMALSLADSNEGGESRTRPPTSAELFERLSRTTEEPNDYGREDEEERRAARERESRRRGKAREDSFATSSTTAHALFNEPRKFSDVDPSNVSVQQEHRPVLPDRGPSTTSTNSEKSQRRFFVSNPDVQEEPPPPAYEPPPHARELDAPGEIIFGPGQPLPASSEPPLASTSYDPYLQPPSGASPGPASSSSSSSSLYPPQAPLRPQPPSPPSLQRSTSSSPGRQLAPIHTVSPSSSSTSSSPPNLLRQRIQMERSYSGGRESFLSTISVAGSFESERTAGGGWRGEDWGVAESPAAHEELEGEDPFGDQFAAVVPSHQPQPVAAPDLFGMLRARREQRRQQLTASNADEPADSPTSSRSPTTPTGPSPPSPSTASPGSSNPIPPLPTRPPPAIPTTSLDPAPVSWDTDEEDDVVAPSSQPAPTTNAALSTPSSPDPLGTISPTGSTFTLDSFGIASTPSFGGFVESVNGRTLLGDEQVMRDIKWGFVPADRKTMHPPLEHEGAFPRGAQLSCVHNNETGEQEFSSFAVEARSWNSLLTYLMWFGHSRFEAAPSDLQADKSGRGLPVNIRIEFYRSFADQRPRVRCRVDLCSPAASVPSPTTLPSSFDADCPSISVRLAATPLLPIPLSQLATLLSQAHTKSRQTKPAHLRHYSGGSSSSSAAAAAVLSARELAMAVDLFKRLNGEAVIEDAEEMEDVEETVLDWLKVRLKRRKRAPGIVKGGADGTGPGRPLEATGPLPEGADRITPFTLDWRED